MNDTQVKFEAQNDHTVDQYWQPRFRGTSTNSQAFRFGLATPCYQLVIAFLSLPEILQNLPFVMSQNCEMQDCQWYGIKRSFTN